MKLKNDVTFFPRLFNTENIFSVLPRHASGKMPKYLLTWNTQRNILEIILNIIKPFSDWFKMKRMSIWFQINRKMVNTIWFRLNQKDSEKISLCVYKAYVMSGSMCKDIRVVYMYIYIWFVLVIYIRMTCVRPKYIYKYPGITRLYIYIYIYIYHITC